jgi:transcriptional regulator with XRE-family HTH domain
LQDSAKNSGHNGKLLSFVLLGGGSLQFRRTTPDDDDPYLDTDVKEIERHIKLLGLVPVLDEESGKTIYRRKTSLPVPSPEELENRISDHLAATREKANITKEEMAELLGLSQQFYGRAERREAHLRVTRLILMIEILGPEMFDVLAEVAPQIFGTDEAEAKARGKLISTVMRLPAKNVHEILTYVSLIADLVQRERDEADQAVVRDVKELMDKNGMTSEDVKGLILAEKAKRGPRKPRRLKAAETGR